MNNFIPRDLHSLLMLLKYNNMLKEIKYSIDHDVVRAIVVDKLGNQYLYIDGIARGYRFKKLSSIIVEVEER